MRNLSPRAGLVLAAVLLGPGCDDDTARPGTFPTEAQPQGPLAVTISASSGGGRAPVTVRYTASVTGGDGVYRYEWSFGDGRASSEASPTVTYVTGGAYTTRLVVTSGSEKVTSAPVIVNVDADLRIACALDTPVGIAPLPVGFTGQVTGGGTGAYGYNWAFGDGGTSTSPNTVYTYNNAGTFSPRLTVTSGAVQATCTDTVRVFSSLLASCGAVTPTTGPAPLTVKLRADANFCLGACTWRWTFGDGASAVPGDRSPIHTYARGSYTATGVVTTGSHSQTCTVNITAQ